MSKFDRNRIKDGREKLYTNKQTNKQTNQQTLRKQWSLGREPIIIYRNNLRAHRCNVAVNKMR